MNIGVKKDLNKFYDTLENIHDMTILDLGSGTGCESRYLAETYGCKVYSLDYSDEMCSINNAINKLCGLDILITVICDDAASLNLSEYNLEGQCDLVITIQSMLFVTEKEKL